jgi:hypothetical protein
MNKTTLILGAAITLAGSALAQVQNSNLPRRDLQLSTVAGVHNDATGNLDAGFGMFDVAAPKQDLPDRAGGLVATSRLLYAIYADRIAGNVVIQFVKSTDGGRSFGAPTTIYTCNTVGGEDLAPGEEEVSLWCHGDEVYVTLLTNADSLGATVASQSLFAIGSADQGQTWSAPLRVSPNINVTREDVDFHKAAATSTGLHVTYEWDYLPGLTGNENFAYARVGFVAGVFSTIVASTDITNFIDGGSDVDDPAIDAEGSVVHIAWKDDSDPVMVGQDQVYSITSFDGGLTFSLPFNHTQFAAPLVWATARSPYAHVDGGYAFTFMEDSRVDQDDVWMDRGVLDTVNGTVNWNVRGVMCSNVPNGPAGATVQLDVDGFLVRVENGVVAILYRDDRQVATNSNYAYFATSRNGGDDFINSTASHFQLTTLASTLYDLDINRNVICGAWEQCSGDEEGALVLSHDQGLSVTAQQFTTLGDCSGTPSQNVDIDDLQCAVTRNGDYATIYVDERIGGSNATNHCFLTGGKYPVLRDLTLVNGTLEMSKIDPSESGANIAFLMISGGGTLPGHAVFGNDYGFFVGLNADLWFSLLMNSAVSTFAGIAPSGDAVYTVPGGIPNLSALLGFPIDTAGGTLSFGPRLLQSYSDPVRF